MASVFLHLNDSKILLTGGSGFLGSYVYKELLTKGVKKKQIIIPRSKKHDLRLRKNCELLTKDKDIVIHLAGDVGGIGKNRDLPATLFYDNAVMGIELMESARKNGVKKFVTIGTICSYPKYTPVPFKEESVWDGYPEETNAPYGLAKKMLLVQGEAYRKQYGFNSIHLLLVNLYGPGDNFDKNYSHVIPSIIRKVTDARKNGKDHIFVWGTGKPSREFIFVEDAAKAIVMATEQYDKPEPVNIGMGFEITIKDLAELICRLMKFKGRIVWDKTKPDGQPRRRLDTNRAYEEFGFVAKTPFEEGLKRTIDWYLSSNGESKVK